jgi:diadenylate cyclase
MVQIAVLALCIGVVVRFLAKCKGSGLIRGLGLLALGFFLSAEVILVVFDLSVLVRVFDYLHTSILVGLLVIFQPELRRGLILLGRYRTQGHSNSDIELLATILADAAESLSRQSIGALIAVKREMSLESFIETGEPINGDVTQALIRTIFSPNTPLHDGALIIERGRIAAAACQLPLGMAPDQHPSNLGMRHRAAICLSEETDAVLLIVSEETGIISLAVGGRLEPIAIGNLSQRLVELLGSPIVADRPRIAA